MPALRSAALAIPESTTEETAALVPQAVDIGLAFKDQPEIYRRRREPAAIRDALPTCLAMDGEPLEAVLDDFVQTVLPLCKNETNPRFMGFAETGDGLARLAGRPWMCSPSLADPCRALVGDDLSAVVATRVSHVAALPYDHRLPGCCRQVVGDRGRPCPTSSRSSLARRQRPPRPDSAWTRAVIGNPIWTSPRGFKRLCPVVPYSVAARGLGRTAMPSHTSGRGPCTTWSRRGSFGPDRTYVVQVGWRQQAAGDGPGKTL